MFKIRFPLRREKPPCAWCLYALGLIQTLVCPCPKCRQNGCRICDSPQLCGSVGGPGPTLPEKTSKTAGGRGQRFPAAFDCFGGVNPIEMEECAHGS